MRPSLDIEDQISNLLSEDKHARTHSMAIKLGVITETVRNHMHKMNKKYLMNSWVLNSLYEANRQRRKTVCQELLQKLHQIIFLCVLLWSMKFGWIRKRKVCLTLTVANRHTAAPSLNKVAERQLNLLEHPPYSPDLSPSDYYLFSPMKASIRGKNYESAYEIMEDIQTQFDRKDYNFYSKAD